MIKKIINDKSFNLVDVGNRLTCVECVFESDTGYCLLDRHESGLNHKDEINLRSLCLDNSNCHWEEEKEKSSMYNLTINETIEFNGYTYQLVQCEPCDNKCNNCIFGCDGHCCLLDDNNTLRDKADDLTTSCTSIAWGVYRLVKDTHDNSSTGVVNPSIDDAPKEPSNDAPRVIKADTKRLINIELTLKEAREYYYSHNPILKDIACRLFTPAELEDVRKCTMNVDIKTAKRLYRNAENAVRDFVLSAFSEEELKN